MSGSKSIYREVTISTTDWKAHPCVLGMYIGKLAYSSADDGIYIFFIKRGAQLYR
jgi:hypothetical protein